MAGLRVIGGIAKGKRLKTRKVKHLRPATDYLREALFNILMYQVPGSFFLDLFAGSGSIGIEALSRGAERVCFVEKDPGNARLIRENLEITGFTDQAEVFTGDVFHILPLLKRKGCRFHIVFIDPPFRQGLVGPALEMVREQGLLLPGGLAIARSAVGEGIAAEKSSFRKKRYGDSVLLFFKNEDDGGKSRNEDSGLSGEF